MFAAVMSSGMYSMSTDLYDMRSQTFPHAMHLQSWLAPALLAAGAPLTLAAQALAEPINGSVGAKQADALAQTVSQCLHRDFAMCKVVRKLVGGTCLTVVRNAHMSQ